MEAPAEALELVLPEPVAVPGRRARVVAGAVALDRQHELAGTLRVLRREVDPVAGRAELRDERDPCPLEVVADLNLEGVERGMLSRAVPEVGAAALGVDEVVAEELRAAGRRPLRVHVRRPEGRDHGHPALGPRDRDVEAPLAALEVDRPEVVQEAAVRGLAVADREDDRVALIALDALEVLDEERLVPALGEELVRSRRSRRASRSASSRRFAWVMPIAITPRLSEARFRAWSRISRTTAVTSSVALFSCPTRPGRPVQR